MFRKSKKETMKAQAGSSTALAFELAQDKKFRKELLEAVGHGAVARDRVRSRIGPMATMNRIASDETLREELSELGSNLARAKGRVEKKQRGGRMRKTMLFAGLAGLIAVPQTRNWLSARLGGMTGGPRALSETIEVEVPVSTVYNQWTQFEDFPQFMEGVEEVKQLDDTRLHWVATVGGKRTEWNAKILEQHPETQVSWISEDGKATRGTVSFEELGASRTRVELSMSYMASGIREIIGSALGLDAKRIRGDLQQFKQMIESRGTETGAWRGEVVAGEAR
jgi:uncharacterized membrane protein